MKSRSVFLLLFTLSTACHKQEQAGTTQPPNTDTTAILLHQHTPELEGAYYWTGTVDCHDWTDSGLHDTIRPITTRFSIHVINDSTISCTHLDSNYFNFSWFDSTYMTVDILTASSVSGDEIFFEYNTPGIGHYGDYVNSVTICYYFNHDSISYGHRFGHQVAFNELVSLSTKR